MRREPEDGRYQALRTWAGERQQLALFTFYMIQASWVLLFSVPQYVALQNDAPLQVWDLLAMLIVAVSLIGEAIADRQLAQFKQDPASRGRTCRRGLWRYSRHPNYFFEWLHWFAYPLLAVGMGWYILIPLAGPIMMFVFLVKVTGIPPTEARALETRGADYRRYQQTTSAFFPWFPKEEPA
jgi:steroid 5-alpha reductase family enzyme